MKFFLLFLFILLVLVIKITTKADSGYDDYATNDSNNAKLITRQSSKVKRCLTCPGIRVRCPSSQVFNVRTNKCINRVVGQSQDNKQSEPLNSSELNCGVTSGSVDTIVHGYNIQRDEFPWLAAIFLRYPHEKKFVCSGSLISYQHVLTAAHCVRPGDKDFVRITLGKYELFPQIIPEEHNQDFKVQEIFIHKDFGKAVNGKRDADIAIYVLDKKATFNDFVRPICLYFTSEPPPPGTQGKVVGWGLDESGSATGIPKKIKLPIVTLEDCRNDDTRFFNITSERTFCAGLKNGSGPCKGDSGSGFYSTFQLPEDNKLRYRIDGIASKSLRATGEDLSAVCDLFHYTVYTDVFTFRFWLREILLANKTVEA